MLSFSPNVSTTEIVQNLRHEALSLVAKSQSAQPILRKKYAYHIEVFAKRDEGRKNVERFIEQGFLTSYNATISISMPWILAISTGFFKAALGIRSATDPLFVEQYSEQPIECILHDIYAPVLRSEIAEIGHLYSNAKKFTIPLFLTTAVSLFCNNYKFMVFAATENVLDLIERSGIAHQMITPADPDKLTKSNNNWGAYYDTNPKVVAISLSNVMQVINHNKKFCVMFEHLGQQISSTTQKLKGCQL
ncbi:MAG: hypothetical protein ACI9C4_000368 [Paraglaciecola sp.]|jgi:hypothetical protein